MTNKGAKSWYFTYDAKESRLIIQKNSTRKKINDDSLMILAERVMFADDDRKHRPFCVMESEGKYFSESLVKRMWLVMVDIENFEIVEQMEFGF